ncbi:uncharacterized protein SPSK_03548 [Sporothrix schenckii 1099-18]|uniref:Uncharacterized protein n=1 Tax=Sporothrix schenckii 1099-18 TaxID=1397361 RepID=A0A0F2LXJ4_SPOSC|nr:uncharacterized protein SPSK_03548 [Sporothrix schenckii 1099-18]KJR82183.1 hypothetical protein SPSK_03548 [Sporothrix schenckii 1099-18]
MNYDCSSPPSYSQGMNKYWIPHKDIHKKVITSHIQFYLGSDATVRSYTKDGEDGFLITTPGECLTDEQIDDLCNKSMEMWERQAAARSLAAADGSSSSLSISPKAPLKRPLHQPVVIARAGGRRSSHSKSHTHSNRSSASSSSSSHHHHGRHSHNHSYSRQQQYFQYPQQQQQRQLPRSQQQHQHHNHQEQQQQQQHHHQQPNPQQYRGPQNQPYIQQHQYYPQPSSTQSQQAVQPCHSGWEPLSPTLDSAVSEAERLY